MIHFLSLVYDHFCPYFLCFLGGIESIISPLSSSLPLPTYDYVHTRSVANCRLVVIRPSVIFIHRRSHEICRYLRRRSGFRPGGDAVIGIQPCVSPAHTSRGTDRIVVCLHPKCPNAHEKTCRQKQQHHQASNGRCGRRRGARGIRRRRNGHGFAGDFQPHQGQ